MIVQPGTLIRWHRKGFRLFWRWKSRAPGRPSVPADLQQLIAAMARANATWGRRTDRGGTAAEARSPGVSAYRQALHGTRRATAGSPAVPAVEHLRAQSRGCHARVRFLRDHHGGFSRAVCIRRPEGRHTPNRPLERNCERLIGTIRRECLDWLIVLNDQHLRSILKEWVAHYNRGRPHASLGPGIPGATRDEARQPSNGHRIPNGHRVVAVSILAGLHHEYRLERKAA